MIQRGRSESERARGVPRPDLNANCDLLVVRADHVGAVRKVGDGGHGDFRNDRQSSFEPRPVHGRPRWAHDVRLASGNLHKPATMGVRKVRRCCEEGTKRIKERRGRSGLFGEGTHKSVFHPSLSIRRPSIANDIIGVAVAVHPGVVGAVLAGKRTEKIINGSSANLQFESAVRERRSTDR
eukprot:3032231-Rhodomonas_salina.2